MAHRKLYIIGALAFVSIAILVFGSVVRSEDLAAQAVGTIAYKRGHEIRLINSDGGNDHQLWQAPLPDPNFKGIRGLQWRPDGGAIAFGSDYQQTCSIYDSDIYTIQSNGSGLKRLTNSPSCAALAGFAKGTVKVTVENLTTDGLFLIYVEGAPDAVVITVSPGAAVAVTIPNVADLGNIQQAVTVINGNYRWIDPSVFVDVQPGKTTAASNSFVLTSQGNVFAGVGAAYPAWHRTGSKVGFIFYEGFMSQISANPPLSGSDSFIMAPNSDILAYQMAWSPISDWILYSNSDSISVALPGSSNGDPIITKDPLTEYVLGLEWLPDESGFLFAITGGQFEPEYGNIYEYNFAANDLSPITNFDDQIAGAFTLSADGQQIVFEHAQSINSAPELWIMNRDGSGMQSLGVMGQLPDWKPGTGIEYANYLYLPMILR